MLLTRMILSGALAALTAFAQDAPARREFEVASIKPSAPTYPGQLAIGLHVDGAQVRCTYLSLKDYIGIAYRLQFYQVVGPEWMASARFDISAKVPADSKRDQVLDMLQTLLTDRFQMKMHREKKEFPVYALVVAKTGLKMKESAPDDAPAPEAGVNVTSSGSRDGVKLSLPGGSHFSIGNNRFEAARLPMQGLADLLTRFLDRPVVNMTETPGVYDFTLECSPEDFRAMMVRSATAAGINLPLEAMRALDGASGDSFHAALRQVGLRLEPRKAPIDVLVVDSIEKTPTEN